MFEVLDVETEEDAEDWLEEQFGNREPDGFRIRKAA